MRKWRKCCKWCKWYVDVNDVNGVNDVNDINDVNAVIDENDVNDVSYVNDVNAGNDEGLTPLETAAFFNAKDVAKAFLSLSDMKKTTGLILTVDGGNVAAMPR